MLRQYHCIRITDEYKSIWRELTQELVGLHVTPLPLVYQHIGDKILENLLSVRSEVIPNPCSRSDYTNLTKEEENALYYIGGYIMLKIKKSIQEGKHRL